MKVTNTAQNGILHVCGGDPDPQEIVKRGYAYSPRVWR